MDDTPTKSAAADIDDPMQQLEHIGDTTELPLPCKQRMRKVYTDVVLRVSTAETVGTAQLRTVRVLYSQKNSLRVHEEDAPWLVSYVASELVTGGVAPIIDPDGSIVDEISQGFPQGGAAVAGLSKGCTAVAELSTGCTMKPIKPMMNFYKLRWDFEGAWEADILRGPRKATNVTCRVNKFTSEKWARVSGVHNSNGGL
jgi:hypothetical protein